MTSATPPKRNAIGLPGTGLSPRTPSTTPTAAAAALKAISHSQILSTLIPPMRASYRSQVTTSADGRRNPWIFAATG